MTVEEAKTLHYVFVALVVSLLLLVATVALHGQVVHEDEVRECLEDNGIPVHLESDKFICAAKDMI